MTVTYTRNADGSESVVADSTWDIVSLMDSLHPPLTVTTDDEDEFDDGCTPECESFNMLDAFGQYLPGDGQLWLETLQEADGYAQSAPLVQPDRADFQVSAPRWIESIAHQMSTYPELATSKSNRSWMLGIAAFAMAWLIQDAADQEDK